MKSSLLVERLVAFSANPDAPGLAPGHMIHMMRHAHRLPATRADDHDIGSLNGTLPFGDAALDLLRRIGARVTLDHHHVLHQDFACLVVHAQDTARLAFVAPGDHLDGVFLFKIDTNGFSCQCHQSTSGASETIFMHFLSRSSLATGPNTRVPIGSPISLINTAAFESNRMYVPSR